MKHPSSLGSDLRGIHIEKHSSSAARPAPLIHRHIHTDKRDSMLLRKFKNVKGIVRQISGNALDKIHSTDNPGKAVNGKLPEKIGGVRMTHNPQIPRQFPFTKESHHPVVFIDSLTEGERQCQQYDRARFHRGQRPIAVQGSRG